MCVKQVSFICVASVVSSRMGVPLAIASVLFCCVSMPTRNAIYCSVVALSPMLLWMDLGVSGNGASKIGW